MTASLNTGSIVKFELCELHYHLELYEPLT